MPERPSLQRKTIPDVRDVSDLVRELQLMFNELHEHLDNPRPADAVRTETAAYTIERTDEIVLADATGGPFNVTLPPVAEALGLCFTVKRVNGGGNVVTIVTPGAETIDGAATHPLAAQYDSVDLCNDGTNWYIARSK